MQEFDLSRLEKGVKGQWMGAKAPGTITGFSCDTRTIRPGDLFLAMRGECRDGHDYLNLALEGGAAGAIVERFNPQIALPQLKVKDVLQAFQEIARIYRKGFDGLVFGVTGSCGKTTTKDLITHFLGEEKTHSTFLNHNNLLGVPLTLVGLDSRRHEYAVIEAGTNLVGEMECLASMIEPDVSIFTNVYPVHLEGLGTVENIAYEKSFLAKATKANGFVFFPSACFQFKPFQLLGDRARVVAYEGEDIVLPEKQLILYRVEERPDGKTLVIIKLPDSSVSEEYMVPTLSKGILSNVALAISACLSVGIPRGQIEERLKTWVPSKHRGQVYYHGKQVYYADCYNANPVAMKDALEIFQKRFDSSYKRMYILGCMGELGGDAPRYHYDVGISLKLGGGDKVLLLGKNAEDYERGLKDAGNEVSQIICLQNKEKAFGYLKDFEGAVFLKGSKLYALWELLPSNV